MSPDPNVPNAVLICSTGALAGSRFEVGAETTIGADSSGQPRVAQGGSGFTARYARIVADGERHRIEPLGGAAEVTIDGVAISSAVPLEKRHSIGVRGVAEFVYSRSAAPAAKPAAPPAAAALPVPRPAATPQPLPLPPPVRDMGTMIEKGGFDALPDLVRRPTPAAQPVPPAAATPAQPPAPPSAPPPTPPAVDKGTMMAKGGFDALPDLARRPTPPAPSAPQPAPSPSQPPAPPAESPHQRGRYTPFADQPPVPAPPAASPAAPPPPPAAPPPPPPPAAKAPPLPSASQSPEEEEGATVAMPAQPVMAGMQLIVTLPDHGRVAYDLKIGDNIVGRGKDADIRIPDPKKWLSRQHVNVRVSREKVELIDLGGANGTYVNGKKITTAIIVPGAGFDLGPSMAFTLRKT